MIRVGFDSTAARAQRAGIGRYAREILAGALRSEEMKVHSFYTNGSEKRQSIDEYEPLHTVNSTQIHFPEKVLYTLWHRLGLRAAIDRFLRPVDVIHGPDFLVPPSNSPSIATIHDLTWEIVPQCAHPSLRDYLQSAVPRSIQRARKVIAVSETTRQDIIERYGVPPHKVETIHNGVDGSYFSSGDRDTSDICLRLGIEGPYLLSVGTLEPRKNHVTLIRAFSEFHRRNSDFTLVLAGRSGWMSEPIQQAIEEARNRGVPILQITNAKDHELRALYQRALCLVYPSWYEGFGLPVLEAMAAGTPVIASDIPVHREIASDAVLYASPDSLDAFISQMGEMVDNDTTRSLLVKRGHKRAQKYTWTSSVSKHLALYKEVANG